MENRFGNKYPEVKAYKTSALDPLRAAQANKQIAMDYEEGVVKSALAEQVAKGWHKYLDLRSIPDRIKYNMDEVAADGNLKRKKKMGSLKQQVRNRKLRYD